MKSIFPCVTHTISWSYYWYLYISPNLGKHERSTWTKNIFSSEFIPLHISCYKTEGLVLNVCFFSSPHLKISVKAPEKCLLGTTEVCLYGATCHYFELFCVVAHCPVQNSGATSSLESSFRCSPQTWMSRRYLVLKSYVNWCRCLSLGLVLTVKWKPETKTKNVNKATIGRLLGRSHKMKHEHVHACHVSPLRSNNWQPQPCFSVFRFRFSSFLQVVLDFILYFGLVGHSPWAISYRDAILFQKLEIKKKIQ